VDIFLKPVTMANQKIYEMAGVSTSQPSVSWKQEKEPQKK
jgi:hypothetical protein